MDLRIAFFITRFVVWFCRTRKRRVSRMSLVHVYFKEMGITKFSRDQLYSWEDIVGTMFPIGILLQIKFLSQLRITPISCQKLANSLTEITHIFMSIVFHGFLSKHFFSCSANFGGSVGLCVGFSLFSAAELLYFLFLRRFLKK